MLRPLIRRPRGREQPRSKERGVTMALVALSMAVIICMAALSIDLGTLYEAKAEAQRAADAAALTAARVISISGITGDPNNTGSWLPACGGTTSYATLAAKKMAEQNLIGGVAVGGHSGSAPLNYLQIYGKDITYATTDAFGKVAVTMDGSINYFSAQDLLHKASLALALIAEY